MSNPLIDVVNLQKVYSVQKKTIAAVNNISFSIHKGETLALVGESGSGKSTVGKCILRLETVTSGKIYYKNKDLLQLDRKEFFNFRNQAGVIFQDSFASLNPRMTALSIIAEPLHIHKSMPLHAIESYVEALIQLVGMDKSCLNRYPHEFSGGQRQRIGIARALALKPEFIVCDEPISALDVSVQAQIINLLKNLQKELKLTYLFIAHDLNVVKYISDRIAVMYAGTIVEIASAEKLYQDPLHPYTQALLSSIPVADPIFEKNRPPPIFCGEPPSVFKPTKGCPFASRCPKAMPQCHDIKPKMIEAFPGHQVACHLYN